MIEIASVEKGNFFIEDYIWNLFFKVKRIMNLPDLFKLEQKSSKINILDFKCLFYFSTYKGAQWCYVKDVYGKNYCQDTIQSQRFPGKKWSYQACATPSLSDHKCLKHFADCIDDTGYIPLVPRRALSNEGPK